jgi:hypothetical protein
MTSDRIRVRVADGLREGLDVDGGRWYAICETHGSLLQEESRETARDDARLARAVGYCEWCEDCLDRLYESRGGN